MKDIDLRNVSVMVIEDDAGGMAILGVMMRYLGMNAMINTTGEGVLEMARAIKPHPRLIFCDINLPNTSGYEILRKIRADKEFSECIVIAITAQDADTEIPKCRAAGFDGFIGKPISRQRFPQQVRRILAGESVWETY